MKDSTNAHALEDDPLAALRIDQTYATDGIGVKKLLLTVPIRKPLKTDFFRVHPEYMLDCLALELKAEREHYFVVPSLAPVLAEFIEPVRLRLCVTRQGTAFLWPIKLPREDRRPNPWHTSAAEVAGLAEKRWTRVTADMQLGAYQPFIAPSDLGDPKWPEEPWQEIAKLALRDKMISAESHPVVRDLLGRA